MRHGERSPTAGPYPTYACWPQAAEWDCSEIPLDYTVEPESLQSRYYARSFRSEHNLNPGSCHQGQLVPNGFRQEYEHGKILRELYVDSFLPSSFDPSITYLRSDDVPRVVLSLEALLHGLYPANRTQSNLSEYQIHLVPS